MSRFPDRSSLRCVPKPWVMALGVLLAFTPVAAAQGGVGVLMMRPGDTYDAASILAFGDGTRKIRQAYAKGAGGIALTAIGTHTTADIAARGFMPLG